MDEQLDRCERKLESDFLAKTYDCEEDKPEEEEEKSTAKSNSLIKGLNDTEFSRILVSVHERGMRLLHASMEMAVVGYKDECGKSVTIKDVRNVYDGHTEHMALYEKLKSYKEKEDGDE